MHGVMWVTLLWVPIKDYKQTLQEIQYTLLWVPIKDYKQTLQEI